MATAQRSMRRGEWIALLVLGIPTFAFALAITIVSTYLPVLASSFASSTVVIGVLIGGEGLMVLVLALLGFVGSIGAAAIALAIFFGAYFVAYEPYRALYPDLVDDEIAGRAQSTQALCRGLATVIALSAGGVLITIAKPLPFLA